MGDSWTFQPAMLLILISILVCPSVVLSFKCYSCGSDLLHNKWQFTGYPNSVRTYSSGCDSYQQLGFVDQVECTSACVTYMFDVRRGPGITQVTIRGCLDQLTGIPHFKYILNGCEFGTIESSSDDGQKKFQMKHQLVTCSFDLCNIYDTTLPNNRCPENLREKYRCKQCVGLTECNYGECHDKWCFKRTITTGEHVQVEKGCSPVNIYNNVTTCKQRQGKTESIQQGVTSLIDVNSEFCVCQGSDCNSAASEMLKYGGAMLISLLLALIFH